MMDPDEIQSGSNILLPFMIKNSSASVIFTSWDDGGVFSNEDRYSLSVATKDQNPGKIIKTITHRRTKISNGNTIKLLMRKPNQLTAKLLAPRSRRSSLTAPNPPTAKTSRSCNQLLVSGYADTPLPPPSSTSRHKCSPKFRFPVIFCFLLCQFSELL